MHTHHPLLLLTPYTTRCTCHASRASVDMSPLINAHASLRVPSHLASFSVIECCLVLKHPWGLQLSYFLSWQYEKHHRMFFHWNLSEAFLMTLYPAAVCTLMLILLPQEGLPWGGVGYILRWCHVNLCPIHTGLIKARACDWAVEGKGGARGLREGGRKIEESHMAWKSDK